MSPGFQLPNGSSIKVSEKKLLKKRFRIFRDCFLRGTWIGCTASNEKESSVSTINFFSFVIINKVELILFEMS